MLRAFRFIVGLFSQKHGIVAFAFFLLLGILMRQAPEATQKSVISAALASVFYPAQMVISSVDEFRSVAHENEMLKEENARLRQETYYASEALQELARLHALVRFDDTRAAAAMDILKDMAQGRQVILFSCHSRERGML